MRHGVEEKGKDAVCAEKKAAIEEAARWIDQQIEHVWHALGAADKQEGRELNIKRRGEQTEYEFVYMGKRLAAARSYFSYAECQWRFELIEVAQEIYMAVKEYFAGEPAL